MASRCAPLFLTRGVSRKGRGPNSVQTFVVHVSVFGQHSESARPDRMLSSLQVILVNGSEKQTALFDDYGE